MLSLTGAPSGGRRGRPRRSFGRHSGSCSEGRRGRHGKLLHLVCHHRGESSNVCCVQFEACTALSGGCDCTQADLLVTVGGAKNLQPRWLRSAKLMASPMAPLTGISLAKVNEECRDLQTTMGESDYNMEADGLESVLRQMRQTATKRKELEREHAEATEQLHQRQEEIKTLPNSQDFEHKKKIDIIETLQSKLRELDKKCELQNVRHEELILEMATIKHSQAKSSDWAGSPGGPVNQEVHFRGMTDISHECRRHKMQTSPPEHGTTGCHSVAATTSATTTMGYLVSNGVVRSTTNSPAVDTIVTQCSMIASSSTPLTPSTSVATSVGSVYPGIGANPPNSPLVPSCISLGTSNVGTSMNFNAVSTAVAATTPTSHSVSFPGSLNSTSYTTSSSFITPTYNSMLGRSSSPLPNMRSSSPIPRFPRSASPLPPDTGAQIDRIMAKIEQDNKILAELDKTRATIALSASPIFGSTSSSIFGSRVAATTSGSYFGSSAYQPLLSSITSTTTVPSVTTAPTIPSSVPTIVTTTFDSGEAKTVTINGTQPSITPILGGLASGIGILPDNPMDYLEIPGKGRVQVYIARYAYDPLRRSPNENPEAELAVNAGEYIYITGGMDEDGFYDGELMASGKKGLVPSNFIQRLTGEDLLEFQRTVLYGIRDDLGLGDGTDDSHLLIEEYRKAIDLSYLDLWDMEDEEDELHAAEHGLEGPDTFFSVLVPAPQKLTLERQLHKSVLISWIPPESSDNNIESYDVYVDGLLKATVKATERMRALIENVDSAMPHRISVRSVTPNKRTSRDAACTMVIGRDVPIAPSCVRATNVTATSAIISWLPSNSNYQHSVCVNNVEVRVVKPGVYRHTISGLTPNTTYRVSVRVKNIKVPMVEDKPAKKLELVSSHIDFKTLQVGLPDPPLDIQVEAGPQDNTILITWLPVTINDAGTSNGAPVTGYAVYADGKKVIDIDSPTGDHALLHLSHLQGSLPKAITVRTKSFDSLSPDSMQTKVPPELMKGSQGKGMGGGKDMGRDGRDHGRDHRTSMRGVDGKDSHDRMGPRRMDGGRGRDDHGPGRDRDPRSMQQPKTSRDYGPHDPRGGRGPPGRDPRGPPRGPHNDKMGSGHVDMRRRDGGRIHRRYDLRGQMIIEPEDNLSDKEIYPPTHMTIPSIEITKDSASEGRNSVDYYSDEEYEMGRDGMRGPRKHGYHEYGRDKPRPHPTDRSHQRPRDRDYYDEYGQPRRGVDNYHGPQNNEYGSRRGRSGHDERPRLFRAIFDYDPRTMSPNPNAADEELPFREGQIIKIFGDMDPDGFYWGESNNKKGLIPGNMVTELPMDQNSTDPRQAGSNRRSGERWGDIYQNMPRRKMVALYDYDPQELSPNVDAEAELSFSTGEVIYVVGDMDEDGFFLGEIGGLRGLVPSNFLTEAPPDYRGTPRREALGPHDAPPPAGKYLQRAGNTDRAGVGASGGRHNPNYGPPPRHNQNRDRVRRQESYSEPVHNEEYGPTAGGGHPRTSGGAANARNGSVPNGPDRRPSEQELKGRTSLSGPTEPSTTTTTATTTTTTTTASKSRRGDVPMDPAAAAVSPAAQAAAAAAAAAAAEAPPPAPSGPSGLLASVTNFASKLSPMTTSTVGWDRGEGGGGGLLPSLTKQNAPEGEASGGLFNTLLNFAKRAT